MRDREEAVLSGAPRQAWIVDAVRTPVGRYGGLLAGIRPDDLGALVLAALVERTGDPRLNGNGGAIALGHPIGCSGARLLTTLVHDMRRRDAAVGLATMCIGGGQGIAMLVERVA